MCHSCALRIQDASMLVSTQRLCRRTRSSAALREALGHARPPAALLAPLAHVLCSSTCSPHLSRHRSCLRTVCCGLSSFPDHHMLVCTTPFGLPLTCHRFGVVFPPPFSPPRGPLVGALTPLLWLLIWVRDCEFQTAWPFLACSLLRLQ